MSGFSMFVQAHRIQSVPKLYSVPALQGVTEGAGVPSSPSLWQPASPHLHSVCDVEVQSWNAAHSLFFIRVHVPSSPSAESCKNDNSDKQKTFATYITPKSAKVVWSLTFNWPRICASSCAFFGIHWTTERYARAWCVSPNLAHGTFTFDLTQVGNDRTPWLHPWVCFAWILGVG